MISRSSFVFGLLAIALFAACASEKAQLVPAYRAKAEQQLDFGKEEMTAGRYEAALVAFDNGLRSLEGHDDVLHLKMSLLKKSGDALVRLGRYADASAAYENVLIELDPAKTGKSDVLYGSALGGIANVHLMTGDFPAASDGYYKALEFLEEQSIRDPEELAPIYNNLGLLKQSVRDFREALDAYASADKLYAETGDERRSAATKANVATVYMSLGDYEKAETMLRESIEIESSHLGEEHFEIGLSMSILGSLELILGRYDTAQQTIEKALEILIANVGEEHFQVAQTLSNLASLYYETGRFAQSQAIAEKSLRIKRAVLEPDHPDIATALLNSAFLNIELADLEAAHNDAEEAQRMYEKIYGPEHYFVGRAKMALGQVEYLAGRLDEAETLLKRSVEILENSNSENTLETAASAQHLGNVFRARKELEDAEFYYLKSLSIREKILGPTHPMTGMSHRDMALVLMNVDSDRAESHYQKALLSVLSDKMTPITIDVYADGIEFYDSLGNEQFAAFLGKQAVNFAQRMRTQNTGLGQAQQQGLVRSNEWVYRSLADLLISNGRLAEAQQVLAMLKEKEYFDYTLRRTSDRSPAGTRASYSELEAQWANSYSEISDRLIAQSEELEALKQKQRVEESLERSLTDTEIEMIAELEAGQRVSRQALNSFLVKMRNAFSQIGGDRAIDFGRLNLESLGALQSMLRSIERTTDERVVLITYLVTDERLRILVTTPLAQVHRDSDINAEDLNRLIFELRDTLVNPRLDPLPAAKRLYNALLRPIADDLRQANAETLLVSLDEAIRYIPIAALHDGDLFVAEKYSLGVFTPAAQLTLSDVPVENWSAAGLGVTKPAAAYRALPAVGLELDKIIRESTEDSESSNGVLAGRIWLDEAFTANALSTALEGQYPVVHIASHFVFNPGTERDSFLVLGDGSKLTLEEFVTGSFPFDDIDLLALSACETALGTSHANGREIEGFGALAQNQGASAVLATLWPVADASTAELMTRFYQYRQEDGLSKGQALRAAQLDFINGESEMLSGVMAARGLVAEAGSQLMIDTTGDNLAHPFYWAPFILMGNWQ